MKKHEIRVTIDSLEKQQKAIEILSRYNEEILKWSDILDPGFEGIIGFSDHNKVWCEFYTMEGGKEITLDELETILKNESNHS
jgi:hypothetical protein